jgi:hypothetical protein
MTSGMTAGVTEVMMHMAKREVSHGMAARARHSHDQASWIRGLGT